MPDLVPSGMTKAEVLYHRQFTKFWRIVGFILVPTVSILVSKVTIVSRGLQAAWHFKPGDTIIY